MQTDDLEDIETDLLLEGVYRRHGFDLRDYARSSLRRRVREVVRAERLRSVSALQERVLRDPACLERLLAGISVCVTSMFRDPAFYLTFRTRVAPLLRTYPFVRVWHAGCATGEEVYSMAILLREEGLYERARIYATDMNEAALRSARDGIFPLGRMQEYTANYQRAGGLRSFSEYYAAAYGHAILDPSLRANIVFSQHNLATDGPFNEFHVILCRNVLIYFNERLQARVFDMLHGSLVTFGVLGLGSQESIAASRHAARYEELVRGQKLFRRVA